MKLNRFHLVVLFCVICVAVLSSTSQARIINSINFLGAHHVHDAEAEYRLLQLAIDIVEARQIGTSFSLNIKGAYRASLLGDMRANFNGLMDARTTGNALRDKWAEVGERSQQIMTWLNGKLRPEYAAAFCEVAQEGSAFQNSLVEMNASESYMGWAFEEIGRSCEQSSSPQEAIFSTFAILKTLAQGNMTNVSRFINALNTLDEDESFRNGGLYGYIFDRLALRAQKPVLFVEDEVYFTGVMRFDIYYEALEQVSREAHTRIPGTHDQTFQIFDLNFTQ